MPSKIADNSFIAVTTYLAVGQYPETSELERTMQNVAIPFVLTE
jgi:hypothetical protein